MPRTTLDIDASVLAALKKRRELEHKSLGQLASELLAKALAEQRAGEPLPPLQWTSKSLGLRIDLEDKDALWNILDGETLAGRDNDGEDGAETPAESRR